MRVRMLGAEDAAAITYLKKSNPHQFRLADAKGVAVVEDENQVLAVGGLFPRLEAAILVNHERERAAKAEAIRLLHNVAMEVAQVHGAHELLVLSPTEIYSNFLVKRLGYERLVGHPLILELP